MTHALVYRFTWLFALVTVLAAAASNWPTWRGPAMTGVASGKSLPLKWSDKENVRWRVELPGPGNSSPIVWGARVFVSQAVQAENRRTLMCFDRTTGKLLWQSGVSYTDPEPTQQENNPYLALAPPPPTASGCTSASGRRASLPSISRARKSGAGTWAS